MTSAQLLSQKEAAEKLGLSPKTLEKWRNTQPGSPPFVRLGSAIKYRASDIDAFINDNVVGGDKPRRRKRAA
jgi:predicted DNA-binding transcriptional regulator AlpA